MPPGWHTDENSHGSQDRVNLIIAITDNRPRANTEREAFKSKRHGGAPDTTLWLQTIVATGASLLCAGVVGFIVCSPFWPPIGGGDDGGQMVGAKSTDGSRAAPSVIHTPDTPLANR